MQDMLTELYSHRVIRRRFSYERFLDTLLENRVPYEKRNVAKQTILVSEREPDPSVFFIEKGTVSLEREDQIIAFLGANQIAGLSNTFIIDESLYTFRAQEKCSLYVFPRGAVVELLLSMQEGWIYLYMNHLNHDGMLVDKCLIMREPSELRLKHCIRGLMRRFGTRREDVIELPKCFSKKVIANYANVSTKTVAQTWKQWGEDGYIDADANHFVCRSTEFLQL
ncbi:Crp/Fnr family transcriptional regulator [Listeria grandensis]|uniref:Crp/Fnr family transcriptional regulator n=1 Tax=Listeria grandensis TaxID=1494963 RepID=A0A7X0Y313_9LIST|nr:Crp/Fnr family transcriptional regulator [Listeria grandensis]MBC1474423.1 Crp/Fnr family transcriptional regulator [Listeria grandensis]MBC1935969.1 Crp/Fnr family transcriptional regulator [Listeria grandensis]MBC6315787.1 Crp/Fnr family transcriptional regulator [Listeria grandensis]